MNGFSNIKVLAVAAVLAVGFGAAAQAQQNQLSVYTGFQSAPHSGVDYTPGGGALTNFNAGWEGRPFEMPPYYGIRYTRWVNERLGFGVEMNHAKVYADDATLAASGFDRLEFTDGLNIITFNGFYRWQDDNSRWTPYVGGGLGFAMPHVDVTEPGGGRTFEYQVTGPAVMLTAGVSYDLTDTWAVFAEYKGTMSFNEADLAAGGSLETTVITNAVNVGLSFSF